MFKRRFPLLWPEGDAPAAGGGTTAAAPAAAAPAAAAPAAAAPATAAAAAPVPDGSIIDAAAAGEAKPAAAAAAAVAQPEAYDAVKAKAWLVEKGGKVEDLDKLSAEDLQKKYETDKAAADKPAEVIEFKMPEGIEIDAAQVTAFKDVLADAKLTPGERAQKLVDMHAQALKAAAKAPYDLWNKTQAEWQTTVKADTELGGQKYDEVRSTIAKVVKDIGGKEADAIFTAFAFTGAGNNPEIVRVMYRLCVAHAEGGHVSGGAPAAGGTAAKVLASMYPSATPKAA